MILKKSDKREKEKRDLITFLKRTKNGEYAKIDESSLVHPRLKEQRETYYSEEEYYYSMR